MTPLSFVGWVFCPSSLCDLWWPLSLWSIGLSVLLFMTSDDPSLFGPLGCLSIFSLWPLMTPFSFVHWVVCPSLYGLWWAHFLLSIGLSVLLFMTSDDPSLFCPLGCLFFSVWPLMNLSLWSIGLSLLLFMASDDPFSFVHWVVCPSSLYGLWWHLSLLSIGLSVLIFMDSDEPFLFCPLGCLFFFSLWTLMTPFSFIHWVVCPSSLYDLWWPLSLLSIVLSVLLLFMTFDDSSLFSPLGCLSFSLWLLMTPFSFVHWVVCPSSLYGLWWPLSILSIGLSVLLFMASDDPFLFCPLGCLPFFSLWPLMTLLSFVHWVVCPSSLYDIWWPLSLSSIVLSVLLFMASDNPSLIGPLGCLPFFSLWPLMTLHSLLSIGFSVLLFMASDEPFLFYPLGCLSFFSLWPLMSLFSFVHWVVCPSFMTSDNPFLFCP